MIRGLVEYGWPDGSRTPGRSPPARLGAFDLSQFGTSQGRDGLRIHAPAVVDGRICAEDGVYLYTVQLVKMNGALAFVARCPESDYVAEFAFDPVNPTWAAGHLHGALTEQIPTFVRWRLGGGEVPWARRAGLPTFQGEPASSQLCAFIAQRLATQRTMDTGPAEGWWPNGMPSAGLGRGAVASAGAVAVAGQRASNKPASGWVAGPGNNSAAAPVGAIATVGQGGVGHDRGSAHTAAIAKMRLPGRALGVIVSLEIATGFLAVLNAALTLYLFGGDRLIQAAGSLAAGVAIAGLGAVALLGTRKLVRVERGPLAWFAIAYAGLVPACCLVGLPVTAWALMAWMSEEVRAART